MATQTENAHSSPVLAPHPLRPPLYERILVPVDNSRHSDEAVVVAARLARGLGCEVAGFHTYAARLHEDRFLQMEPGLPEPFRAEEKLASTRRVHGSLIADGLRLVSESYLDHAEEICRGQEVPFERRLAEGTNYVEVLREIGRDGCDLVALGALGLGARRRSLIGSVSERVLRRAPIDVLLVRKARPGTRGVMVATDGSPESFTAVGTALRLGGALGEPVEVVSVFDPQFHITAFHSIAGVLSKERAKVFAFDQQRTLHNEIIDGGLEQLYGEHLVTASRMAEAAGEQVETTLLTGKPFQCILDHAQERRCRVLVVGRFGAHRTDYAEIGSTSENIARLARCSVLVVAEGPHRSGDELPWAPEAEARLMHVPESMRQLTRQRVEAHARRLGETTVTLDVVEDKYRLWGQGSATAESDMTWSDDALAVVERIPEFVRGMVVKTIEGNARAAGHTEISKEIVDDAGRRWRETGIFHHSG
jgi:nucleotide-binding universal stress UspA family protein